MFVYYPFISLGGGGGGGGDWVGRYKKNETRKNQIIGFYLMFE